MLEILEVPTVRRQVTTFSVETYHRLTAQGLVDRRNELLRGVIVKKMSKSPLHEYFVNLLYALVRAAARPGQIVVKEGPLTLADSEPEPDIAVVTGELNDFRTEHPRTALLVIEIALSSEAMDREKMALYAEAGVGEFWLVLPESGTIEVFTAPQGPIYRQQRTVRRGETLVSTILPGLQVALENLFA